MTNDGLELARTKMREAGVGHASIEVFADYYRQIEAGQTGMIAESEIEAVPQAEHIHDAAVDAVSAHEALSKTVILKLNGGLGTSMGLAAPKSLLPVRDGMNFLDITVRQVLAAREQFDVKLPLLLMHSFATRQASLDALAAYPDLPVDSLPLDFQQSQEPKLRADDLTPVTWPEDPSLEWCPPGHGDLYPSLRDTGVLDQLIDAGFEYAAVSNCDNLGAAPSVDLAGWFASTGASFAMEVCRRTANDRKGGHVARRISDGHLILRESAQTADEDKQYFEDENRHVYFNTNNLWLNLRALKAALDERDGVLGLPIIRNAKTVDPKRADSTPVIQIESAMGAAIEVFEQTAVIEVGRERFVPVKKTNELLLLRSDCYDLDPQSFELVATTERVPEIDLDPSHHKLIADFEAHFPAPVSLTEANSLAVRGDVSFGSGVKVVGDVTVESEQPLAIADGTVLGA